MAFRDYFMRAPAFALAALAVAAAALPFEFGMAQPDGGSASKQVCRLTNERSDAAIAAFDKLMPVFHNDRCANCHNKIDPLVPRGHPDIKEELSRLRDRATFDAVAASGSALHDQAYASLVRFLDGKTLTLGERNDLMFGNACAVCHDGPAERGKNWRMAPPADNFHDKDRLALCRHIHTSLLTKPASAFQKHMRTDGFVIVAFQGTRGLNGLGESIYESYAHKPYAKLPIQPETHDSTLTAVQDWLVAHTNEDGNYPANPDCGCRPFHYKFHVRQTSSMKLQSGGAVATNRGDLEYDMPLTFADDGHFTGSASAVLSMEQQVSGGPVSCTSHTDAQISLGAEGTVTDGQPMQLKFTLQSTPTGGQLICQTPRGPMTLPVSTHAGQTFSSETAMPATVDAEGHAEFIGDGTQSLAIDVTLLEEP